MKIGWERRGDGPALLLIQGLGYARWGWEPVLDGLARSFDVLVFDNRGIGESDAPPGPYTAARAGRRTRRRSWTRPASSSAHVVGTSLGGMVAQELALARPERVDRLVLACTTPGGPTRVSDAATHGRPDARAGDAPRVRGERARACGPARPRRADPRASGAHGAGLRGLGGAGGRRRGVRRVGSARRARRAHARPARRRRRRRRSSERGASRRADPRCPARALSRAAVTSSSGRSRSGSCGSSRSSSCERPHPRPLDPRPGADDAGAGRDRLPRRAHDLSRARRPAPSASRQGCSTPGSFRAIGWRR